MVQFFRLGIRIFCRFFTAPRSKPSTLVLPRLQFIWWLSQWCRCPTRLRSWVLKVHKGINGVPASYHDVFQLLKCCLTSYIAHDFKCGIMWKLLSRRALTLILLFSISWFMNWVSSIHLLYLTPCWSCRDEYYAWGLHQIAKAVSFLNNDCKLVSVHELDINMVFMVTSCFFGFF